MPQSFWQQIVTLPPSIAKLTAVTESLWLQPHRHPTPDRSDGEPEEVQPHTSRRLHWFPYEITRCPNLQDSAISTRHLYGNFKHRMPFPALPTEVPSGSTPDACSVCQRPLPAQGVIQIWISLRVVTDVLPLLVHACSEECVRVHASPASGPGELSRPAALR